MSVWNLFSTLSTALLGAMDETPDPVNVPLYDSDRYTPSIQDVLAVKQILINKGDLPLELVDTIIDTAEYWVRTTTCRTDGEISIVAGREERENRFLLRSYPLGYVPTKDNSTTLPMATDDEYPSVESVPLALPSDFLQNATQEVIDRWTKESLSRGEFPCRKIVFTIKSHDQGWGGPANCKGTYKGSSTWFDVGLEKVSAFRDSQLPPLLFTEVPGTERVLSRPDAESRLGGALEENGDSAPIICWTRTVTPRTEHLQIGEENPESKYEFRHALDPGLDCLQKNRTATRNTKQHTITWSCHDNTDPDSVDGKKLDEEGRGRATANGEYVRNLKIGDVVTVWGKARYGGWVNNIEEMKIDIYWLI